MIVGSLRAPETRKRHFPRRISTSRIAPGHPKRLGSRSGGSQRRVADFAGIGNKQPEKKFKDLMSDRPAEAAQTCC